jgi:polyhydroxyalkanoate synthesis repressor PhaR
MELTVDFIHCPQNKDDSIGGIMKEIKIIKRYQNRKLYDTHESSYVTLDEIAKMIKGGEDLRVIDNKTKNDITAATLTQLLYESERKAKTQPSVELLKEIIRHGDGSFSGYIQTKISTELVNFEQDTLKDGVTATTNGRATVLNQ